jgi:hypothetical protein
MRGPIWRGLGAEQGGFEPAGLCASGWRVTLAITGKILHFDHQNRRFAPEWAASLRYKDQFSAVYQGENAPFLLFARTGHLITGIRAFNRLKQAICS